MTSKDLKLEKILYWLFGGIILLFLLGFVWINLNPEQWYNYDIYSDAMIAKHMVQSRSLFPRDWTYGNQIYVTATPTVAALFYALCGDTVLALGLASVTMTLLTILSLLWCLYPFVGKKGCMISLLCLIGGVIFGTTASSDPKGLQVFYTMGSYYACYVIGILLTVGLWLRLLQHKKVSKTGLSLCLLLNMALSMQSLRELLVLNLPLCGASLLYWLLQGKERPTLRKHKGSLFAVGTLGSALAGVGLIRLLKVLLPIKQIAVLSEPVSGWKARLLHSLKAFLEYIGLQAPQDGITWWKLLSAIFCITLVLYCTVHALSRKKLTVPAALLLYGWLSVGAVFCAGVLVLSNRPIYYFTWYLLVAFSAGYFVRYACPGGWKKTVTLLLLLGICTSSLYYNYRLDLGRFTAREENCKTNTELLLDRGITHVYYDGQWNFYGSQLAAYSEDRLQTSAFFLNPSGLSAGDLLKHTDYLCAPSWYDGSALDRSYLLLSEKSLNDMSDEYKTALLSHLELQLQCEHLGVPFYFYSMDETVFRDLNNGRP